jgi:hypothetical protein
MFLNMLCLNLIIHLATDRRFDRQQITLAADLNIPPGSGGPWPGIEPGLFYESAATESA